MTTSLSRRFPFAAASLLTWSAYAVIETLVGVVLVPSIENRVVSLCMLGAYALFGFALGLVFDILFERAQSGANNGSTIALTTLFTAHALTAPGLGVRSLVPLTVIAALIMIVAIAGIVFPRVSLALRVVTNPWTASILLLGPIWLARDLLFSLTAAEKSFASALFVVIAVAVSALVIRLRHASEDSPSFVSVIVSMAVAAMLVLIPRHGGSATVTLSAPRRVLGPPNIILVVMDTVRGDHTSLLGYARDTTPTLRTMPGTTFVNAFAPSNMTLSSHASMFTGLLPSANGAHMTERDHLGVPLSPRFLTIAELLSSRGYETLAIVANTGFLSTRFGLNQGFGTYECRSRSAYLIRESVLAILEGWPRTDYRRAEEINADVLRVLRDRRGGAPVFLFINYMDAHAPYAANPTEARRFINSRVSRSGDALMKSAADGLPLSKPELEKLVSQYDAAIATVDAEIGRLLVALRQQGLWDNSLVIITSDHGEGFGEHGVFGHGASLYQEQIHVPLVIRWPGQSGRQTSSRPTSLMELFEIASSADSGLGRPSTQVVLAEGFASYELAVIENQKKLILGSHNQLYDLATDPRETRNLALQEQYRPVVAKMSSLKQVVDVALFTGAAPSPIDAETRSHLRSLGYLAH
jgi:Sulfatase